MIAWARGLWEAITEPRHLKVAYLLIYLGTIAVGVVTISWPPHTIEGPLGTVATTLWASLFIAGGLAGAVTVLPGWWWAERTLGIGLILIGLGIYLSVAVTLHVQSATGSRLTQIGIIVLAACPFLLRGLVIREYSYEPRRG